MHNEIRWFKYEILPSYPHLSDNEAAIWSRFISKYPDRFNRIAYDVCVGEPRPCAEPLDEKTLRNRHYLGRYKIDVLAEDGEFFYIIELKKEATTKALGEVWLYERLFNLDYNPNKPLQSFVITDSEMPNIRATLEEENIGLIVV